MQEKFENRLVISAGKIRAARQLHAVDASDSSWQLYSLLRSASLVDRAIDRREGTHPTTNYTTRITTLP